MTLTFILFGFECIETQFKCIAWMAQNAQQSAQIDDQFEDAIHLLRDHGEVGLPHLLF